MVKKTKNYHIFSLILVIILGTILHFTYKWSGYNPFVALFSATNESVWEHLKLLYFPIILSLIIGLIFFRSSLPSLVCSKTISIIISMLFIVIFFYTYTGILGRNIAIIDISSFAIAGLLAEYVSYRINISYFKCNQSISIFILFILALMFIYFTFNPPKIALFKDPITQSYGPQIETKKPAHN